MFLDGAGHDISNQETRKKFFTNGQFPSDADSSGISLEVFIQYADACTPSSNIPSWCGLPPHPAQPPDCHGHRLVDNFQSGNSTVTEDYRSVATC